VTVEPFLIGPNENANTVDSVDHSHVGLARKMNVSANVAGMDQFALHEYSRYARRGGAANEAQGTQFARLVMSHVDCDTIPFLWQYASRFVLFDNIFATQNTPSTPNAIAMMAGQSGETQWVEHGPDGQSFTAGNHSGTTQGPPIVNDPQLFLGSLFDVTETNRQPRGAAREDYDDSNISANLAFASLPLAFLGRDVKAAMSQADSRQDLRDIQQDIDFIVRRNGTPVIWRWYEEGYDHEATDSGATASHESFISHHDAPMYFGYLAKNPALRQNFRGLGDFFSDMAANDLPPDGGVFYLRGGYANISRQLPYVRPGTPDAKAQAMIAGMKGDDDHPG
jgi:phospholipase C